MKDTCQYIVMIGNYGSGKTELSLNFAIKGAREGKQVALVDLDIVNPYFRSSEQTALLKREGIRLIMPPYAGTNIDLPVLGAEVERVFVEDYDLVVFDVGGDSVGATALGRYHGRFEAVKDRLNAYYVVNTRRPLAGSPDDICFMMDQIERCSRMRVTGFINNSNLSFETTAENLAEGMEVLGEVVRRTGRPIAYISGTKEVLHQFSEMTGNIHPSEKLLPIETYTRPVWMEMSLETL